LDGVLRDLIAHDEKEMEEIIFAKEFGRITDMQLGPDGNLYILSTNNKGAGIDRVISAQATS
jgi:aldose sugar dehydrogenase